MKDVASESSGSQPRGQAPPMCQKINLRGDYLGRKEETFLLIVLTFIFDFIVTMNNLISFRFKLLISPINNS